MNINKTVLKLLLGDIILINSFMPTCKVCYLVFSLKSFQQKIVCLIIYHISTFVLQFQFKTFKSIIWSILTIVLLFCLIFYFKFQSLEDNYFYYEEYNLTVPIKNTCFLPMLMKKKILFLLYCWACIAQPLKIYHFHNHCFVFIKSIIVY